jgi:hypothetical protein
MWSCLKTKNIIWHFKEEYIASFLDMELTDDDFTYDAIN